MLGGKVFANLPAARLASPVAHVTVGDPPLFILRGLEDKKVLPAQSEILRDRYN